MEAAHISPDLMEKIDAGIEWANENIPDWREYVDPTKLNMTDAEKCVLGQYMTGKGLGDFYTAQAQFFNRNWDRTNELGFTIGSLDYAQLQRAWLQKLNNDR